MERVLIVDDEELVRVTVRQILENAGYETSEASDGQQALDDYKESRPDLVITDIIMPNKEGIETIIELRAMDPEAKIIAISGGGRIGANDYLELAKRLGANKVIAKPLNSEKTASGGRNRHVRLSLSGRRLHGRRRVVPDVGFEPTTY